jgi:hypothetical protein
MAAAPPNIIGRDEARALGLKRYFTGKPCKHGHVAERVVSSPDCVECRRGRVRGWRAANPEKVREGDRERARKSRAADPERTRKNARTWRAANLERARERDRLRYAKNKARILSQKAAKRAANKDKISSRLAAQQRAARAGSELNGAGQAGL